MAMGPIPFSAIDRYADRYGIDVPDDFEALRRVLRHMDMTFLRLMGEGTKT